MFWYNPSQQPDDLIVGTEQWYLELLTGEPAAQPIQRGEALELADLRQRFQSHSRRWEAVFERIGQLDVMLPATEWPPAIAQGQELLVVQAIQRYRSPHSDLHNLRRPRLATADH